MIRLTINIIKHSMKLVCHIATLITSACLVFAAYGGYISPESNRYGAVALLGFPLLLGFSVFWGLFWVAMRRWRYAIPVWVAILLSWPTVQVVCPLNISTHSYTAHEDSTKFKVLTFNVENFHVKYSGDDAKDIADAVKTINYILSQDADVVLLQEASLSEDYNNLQIPDSCKMAIKVKYPYRDHGYHDQVIWSKHPYTAVVDDSIKTGFASPDNPIDSYHFYARAFDVLVPGHKVRFINCHLHSLALSQEDRDFYERLTNLHADDDTEEMKVAGKSIFGKLRIGFIAHAEEARILRQVLDQSDENVIVCGDFNDVPASYAYRTIKGDDLTDAWEKCGFGAIHTFHSSHLYFKIDHVLYRGDMIATECVRHKAGESDHYPIVTTFVWKH